eukprot:gene12547-13833_t
MRGRIAAFKRDISVVMDFISQIINREHAADFQLDQQQAYRSQNAEGSHNLGRPYLDITRDQLEHLRSIHFSWKNIAELLNVSYSTVKRRRKEFEMEESRFSNITDNELDIIYANLTSQEGGNLGTPNLGTRRFMGALRSRAIRVQRWRVSEYHTAIEDIDSFGIDPDPDSVPLLDDTNYQVNLDAPNAQKTEEEMQFWPDPLQHDGLQGVGIYNECLRIVQR